MTSGRVAVVANYAWAGISSPLINTVGYLRDRDYSVDLHLERPDLRRFPVPPFIRDGVSVIVTRGPGRGYLSDLQFAVTVAWRPRHRYIAVIAFDPRAIFRGWLLSRQAGGTLIYHNLEFLLPGGLRAARDKLRERAGARHAAFVVTQDEARADWLSADLRLDRGRFRVVVNSSRGLVPAGDSGYFRRTFGIGDDKRIVLCIGSMIREHFVEEITRWAASWDDRFVLVLHGWFPDARVRRSLEGLRQQAPERIFISDRLFDDSAKFTPILSCDIGFVGFRDENPNQQLTGRAAGKLFDFMKAAKPILARDASGTGRLVEELDVGVAFRRTEDIPLALRRLMERYEPLRRNCEVAFRSYEFDRVYSAFWAEVLERDGVGARGE